MNLTDILALAKQGYKPADIKELIAMADTAQGQTETNTGANIEPHANNTGENTEPPVNNTGANTEPPADNTGAEEIAKLQAQLEETQKALKAAQKSNIQQNVQPQSNNDSEKNIADWARSFM